MLRTPSRKSLRQATALALVVALCSLNASAGIIIRGTQGLITTSVDGVYYDNVSGLSMTGADALTYHVNGIFDTKNTSGLSMTGADGTVATVDGVSYTGSNSWTAVHADGLSMTGADGLSMTGADGLSMTGADGTTWQVASVTLRNPQGLSMTGADGLSMTGADGLSMTGADGLSMTGADGIMMGAARSVHVDSAAQVVATRLDGTIFYAPVNGLSMTGADGLSMTGADGVLMWGVQGLSMTGADAISAIGAQSPAANVGLMSFDPELATMLDRLTDDSNVNAAVVFRHPVTDADIADLKAIGVRGGTRFQALPVVVLTASKWQIVQLSRLPNVRYVTHDRTLDWNADESRAQTGLLRMRQDADLQRFRGQGTLQGNGVVVAVLDTGLDSTHPDISKNVLRNVKLADYQGANLVEFLPPVSVEKLPDTDQLSGHGTFVGGLIAGTGASSAGKYSGYAPKAKLVGLSAGDASLFNVLAGFDYILSHPELNVRVVNCSFSANTTY